jgi:hypothetical protein
MNSYRKFRPCTEKSAEVGRAEAGIAASLAANVAVAEPTVTGRVIAAWPSFSLNPGRSGGPVAGGSLDLGHGPLLRSG